MSISKERAQHAEDRKTQLQKMVAQAKTMKNEGKSNSEIANAMGITESYIRNLIPPEINSGYNWGYNCLTPGIHHGRPEAIWNLPLFQAVNIFTADELEELVVWRIYTDATIYVHSGVDPHFTPEWAEKVKDCAEELYQHALEAKMNELTKYYTSSQRHRDMQEVVERVGYSNYQPLHGHDSINMLCRIIGSSCLRRAHLGAESEQVMSSSKKTNDDS